MNAREIRRNAKAWMAQNDVRNVDIQNALNMKRHNLVSDTLRGRRDHRRVLRYLIERGCPSEFLALPEDMRKAA
jgi:hypothetical protein